MLLFGSNKVVIINGMFMRVYLQLVFNEFYMSISLCYKLCCLVACATGFFFFFMEKRPTSCSWVFSEERSGVLRVRLGEGEAGFRNSSSTESELDMASPGFSVSPAAENTTITLGRGSVRLS